MRRLEWLVLGAILLPQPLDAQSVTPETFFVPIKSDSIRVVHYVPDPTAPSAPTVVIVPGWPGSGTDVLGLGRALAGTGSDVFVFQPRGHGSSSGVAGFRNGLEDAGAVIDHVESDDFPGGGVRPGDLVLLGYSWGGGIALAFAAAHPAVRRVVSVAGSDHGAFIRRFDGEPEYGALFRQALLSTRAPRGPVRFDLDEALDELRSDWREHDLVTIAPRLADRDLLIVAGWDDDQVELEYQVLPFYRALKRAGAGQVSLMAFQDGHAFRSVRTELARTIQGWMVRD